MSFDAVTIRNTTIVSSGEPPTKVPKDTDIVVIAERGDAGFVDAFVDGKRKSGMMPSADYKAKPSVGLRAASTAKKKKPT